MLLELTYLIVAAIKGGDLSQVTSIIDDGSPPLSSDIRLMARLCVIYNNVDVLHYLETIHKISNNIALIRELLSLSDESKLIYPHLVGMLFHSPYPIMRDSRLTINQGIGAIRDGRIVDLIKVYGGQLSNILFDLFPEHIDYIDLMNAFADTGDSYGVAKIIDMMANGNVKYNHRTGAVFVHHVCFFDKVMIRGSHNPNIVRMLLDLGASTYRETSYSASRKCNMNTVRMLDNRILKDTKARYHYPELLHHAIQCKDNTDVISYTLSKKELTSDILESSLKDCIEFGSVEGLMLILNDARVSLDNDETKDLISQAAIKGEIPCMMYLLSHSDMNLVGYPISIHIALRKGYVASVMILLDLHQELRHDWEDIVKTSHEYIEYQTTNY